jgi:hypothetical protein
MWSFRSLPALDRYAPRCANFVLVVTRIAVLGARSAPKILETSRGAPRGSQGAEPLGWFCLRSRCSSPRSPLLIAAPAWRASAAACCCAADRCCWIFGYRYKQLFADEIVQGVFGLGDPLRAHELRAGVGVRF